MINFDKLGTNRKKQSLEPRDIFMALPLKDKQYEYPRDVQSEVWKKWYEDRDSETTIIKMNTGSGKTVVGLTILKSCLMEGKGPATYVVPDNFLIQQVTQEAKLLGIDVVTEEDDYKFISNRAILVMNVHKLVNGRSKFGIKSEGNIKIGSILIDDVHACMDTIKRQFTFNILYTHPAYEDILKVLEPSLRLYSEGKFQDIIEGFSLREKILVPFWVWQKNQNIISKIIKRNYNTENEYIFNYPLIEEFLMNCSCILSNDGFEITPKSIPIEKIKSLVKADRKIFMSATLADDSVFVSTLGIDLNKRNNVISPEKANDIGDRLILIPQLLNHKITDQEIKSKLKKMSRNHNVVVIAPSNARVKFWKEDADLILDKDSIYEGVKRLKTEIVGLTIVLNKYDGIDLPDDACRILVIDGLPNMRNGIETYEHSTNLNSRTIISSQIQKIEQGMGRGVRSNNDYCVTVLMGKSLVDTVIREDGANYFSNATKLQYELSQNLWNEISQEKDEVNIDEIFELSRYCLERDINWINYSKDALSDIYYDTDLKIDETEVAIRDAFNNANEGYFSESVKILEAVKNKIIENELTQGYLMQHIAEYKNHIDEETAQQILISARKKNKGVLRSIEGIVIPKLVSRKNNQAETLVKYITDNDMDGNGYLMKLNDILGDLSFEVGTSSRFEQAIMDISFMLGIESSRPESECGKGPDNLWSLGSGEYLVIECKNETTSSKIKKSDCNQLNGSIQWFLNEYRDTTLNCYPVMIHSSNVVEYAGSLNSRTKIMQEKNLTLLKENILSFAQTLVESSVFGNTKEIQKKLAYFNLVGTKILDTYTVTHR